MREPWETLLGQYRDHWFLGPYVEEPMPPIRDIVRDERFWCLSSGEQAMVYAAEAILRLNECWLAADDDNRARIDAALRVALDA